jgi:hypothetical protein
VAITAVPLKVTFSEVLPPAVASKLAASTNKSIIIVIAAKDKDPLGDTVLIPVITDPPSNDTVAPSPVPAPVITPSIATTAAAPRVEELPSLTLPKADANTQILLPINVSLPQSKYLARITAPSTDATSTQYSVEAKAQDDSLRIWRSGLRTGQLYWELTWTTGVSSVVGVFNVITTKGTASKTQVVVQPYVLTIGAAPSTQPASTTQPAAKPKGGPVDLFDPDA